MNYSKFLEQKNWSVKISGIEKDVFSEFLFDYQKEIVRWALKKGKAAIFADTGLGKTIMQLEWAQAVFEKTNKSVLIVAPLCVAAQTEREAAKFGYQVKYVRDEKEEKGIYTTNYEIIDKFDLSKFSGIVLDESSILKHQDSKTRKKITESCANISYKLSCTATPSPNDFMEIGNQAEFLGIMRMSEMLSTFFVHDGGETQKWRLKGHGKDKFWKWMASWAIVFRKPETLGFYGGASHELPELETHHHTISHNKTLEGFLFPVTAQTLQERVIARRQTVEDRTNACARKVNEEAGQWIVWCNLNSESSKLVDKIKDAVEIRGSDSHSVKEKTIIDFMDGNIRVLVTKPSIFGFGLNLQNCNKMAFVGLNDSYEEYYQAVRRCWRYGQKEKVNVHIFTSDIEGAVLQNIQRKERQMEEMHKQMENHMKNFTQSEFKKTEREQEVYITDNLEKDQYKIYLGDCVEGIKKIESESIGYSIFSPPFSSLYTYSNSDRDMGNSKNDAEFFKHFEFLVKDLYRVIMPGREISVHCMNLPTSKQNHGYIGLRDFRGEIIRAFEKEGFYYHSEVCIWKDPVVAMQRTKALGLLWKQLKKDSSMSRMGLPDYVVTFRKPGENNNPISHTPEDFPVALWQKIASPIWMDIDQSKTLNRDGARENEDERHIAPLQLDVIERCLNLYSKRGDIVLSPFLGIGSEGYCSVKMGRKFVGFELKKSYFECAKKNLEMALIEQKDLFNI